MQREPRPAGGTPAEQPSSGSRADRIRGDATSQELAALVSHELNNALTAVFAGVDFVRYALATGDTSTIDGDLDQIRGGADRILALSARLREIADAPPPAASPGAPGSATPRPARRLNVLVIDDEPALRELVQQALASAHEVVAASSAREALRRVGEGERFDVILCDLEMPEVDGNALYTELLGLAPDLARRVVFMTGGAYTPRLAAFLETHSAPRLTKPFGLQALREALRAVGATVLDPQTR